LGWKTSHRYLQAIGTTVYQDDLRLVISIFLYSPITKRNPCTKPRFTLILIYIQDQDGFEEFEDIYKRGVSDQVEFLASEDVPTMPMGPDLSGDSETEVYSDDLTEVYSDDLTEEDEVIPLPSQADSITIDARSNFATWFPST
jgi:hypothetical protein